MYADVLWYVNQRVICHPIQAVLVRSDTVDQHRSGAGNANITPKVTRDTMCVVLFFQERLPFQTMLVLIEEISPLHIFNKTGGGVGGVGGSSLKREKKERKKERNAV